MGRLSVSWRKKREKEFLLSVKCHMKQVIDILSECEETSKPKFVLRLTETWTGIEQWCQLKNYH
jgi:hypothetical protein